MGSSVPARITTGAWVWVGLPCYHVAVAKQTRCNINKGKGRLKSWTLCDGSSEGCVGLGPAAPVPCRPPPTPGVAAQEKHQAPYVGCLPDAPSHGPVAGSRRALRVPAQRPSPAWPPPHCRRCCPPLRGGGGRGRAHTGPPSVCDVAHQSRLPLVVSVAAMLHPPVAPARLAGEGPMRVAQCLHGPSLPHPPRPGPLRRWWQGRLGVTAAGRVWHGAIRRHSTHARISRRLHRCGLLGGQK